MRVLVAAERIGRAGGMERYLEIVLPALLARGATIHVVARDADAAGGDHGAGDREHGETGPAPAESGKTRYTVERVRWSDEHDRPDVSARAAVERALAEFAPDVAVAHNVMDAGIVEALRGAPRFVYHVHDHRPFCPNGDRVFPRSGRNCAQPLGRPCAVHSLTDGCAYGPRRRTLVLIRRRERLRDAIATADAVVVAAAYVGDRAADSGIMRERIVEISLPLPDHAFAAIRANDIAAARHAPYRGDHATLDDAGRPAIVFAGRFVPQKGLDSLVRAVARIAPERRPRVRAVGDGPDRERVAALAAASGVALDAPGAVAPQALRDALDACAFAVLPSRWAEPFGYVGIEAFARGRTVVAYDVGGVRAWLRDGHNGVIVPPGDEPALAGAIDALLHDHARRARLSAIARDDAERYRIGPSAASLLATYRG